MTRLTTSVSLALLVLGSMACGARPPAGARQYQAAPVQTPTTVPVPATQPRDVSLQQRLQLETLKAQLVEPDRDTRTRRQAAAALLAQKLPGTTELLVQVLQDSANRPAQSAVCEAVAQNPKSPPELVKPLLALLSADDSGLRTSAAAALISYHSPAVLDELIARACSARNETILRQAAIGALSRSTDKKSVAALVALTADADGDIRNAACDALTGLTSIRAFGRKPAAWQNWWAQNKDKPAAEWLTDLVENLARSNAELEKENADLRRRLLTARNDVYLATPVAGRDALLADMLKDAMPEVRQLALKLAQERLAAGPLADALQQQVQGRLTDSEPAVRQAAVLVVAGMGGDKAAKLLSARLDEEQSPEVRQAIFQAFGVLRLPELLPSVLTGIAGGQDGVAAAAAGALARIAEKENLAAESRDQAVKTLAKRYRECVENTAGGDSAALREALLSAMGSLRDKRLTEILIDALADHAATVRLSATKALQSLGQPESAKAVAPLLADDDRGVRLAAIAALGSLAGGENLAAILDRTDAKTEPEAAVRQQAWQTAMALLAKAEPAAFKPIVERLEKSGDDKEHLVAVLKLWSEKTVAGGADNLPIRRRLGQTLLVCNRPAEAATELSAVYSALAKANDAQAPAVQLLWLTAMIQADDPAAPAAIADAANDTQTQALALLQEHLHALQNKKDADNYIRLAEPTLDKLAGKLTLPQKEALQKALAEARDRQKQADQQRVAGLAAKLTAADEPTRLAAVKELTDMKQRCVEPLLGELRAALQCEDAAVEKAILDVLTPIAPRLKGYDPKAPQAEKLKTVETWLKSPDTQPIGG